MRAKKEIEYQSEKKQFVFVFIFSRIDFSGNSGVRKWA